MARYSVLIKPSAVKELEAVSLRKIRQQLVRRIQQLADNPRPPGCQKVSGRERFRVRQGSYRIVDGIEDAALIVTVVRIGHRREIYRGQ